MEPNLFNQPQIKIFQFTQQTVREIFDYKDGFLYWKIPIGCKFKPGDVAGFLHRNTASGPRYKIGYKGRQYFTSRLIFLWHHGWLPEMVDHKDRNQMNNNIENLRAASRSQNGKNIESLKNSSSKYLGVSWYNAYNKWRVQIANNQVIKHVGYYLSEEAAALAYNEAAIRLHGEFANLNIIHSVKQT